MQGSISSRSWNFSLTASRTTYDSRTSDCSPAGRHVSIDVRLVTQQIILPPQRDGSERRAPVSGPVLMNAGSGGQKREAGPVRYGITNTMRCNISDSDGDISPIFGRHEVSM